MLQATAKKRKKKVSKSALFVVVVVVKGQNFQCTGTVVAGGTSAAAALGLHD